MKQKLYLSPLTEDVEDVELFDEKQLILDDGVVINYGELGEGDVILCVHGLGNNWVSWIPMAKHLYSDFRVVMLDLPGFGESSRLEEYSLEIAANYIAEFIDKLGIRPVALVGLSLGSQVIAKFVEMHGRKIDAAILNGPIFKIHDLGRVNGAFSYLLNGMEKVKGTKVLVKKFVANTLVSYTLSKYLNAYNFSRDQMDNYAREGKRMIDPKAWMEMTASASKMKIEESIDGKGVPVMFVFGSDDKWSSAKSAEKLLESREGRFEFEVVSEAGHIVSSEKPKAVAKLIHQFLKSL
ncbi:MAG: alpha/beta fold hydrolase [Candidatus Dojkabacteria bacterium]